MTALKLEYEVAAAEKDLDDDLMITATVVFEEQRLQSSVCWQIRNM